MGFAQPFIHHAAKHLGEPEVGTGEHAEDRRHSHDHVEMSYYEVGSVEKDIERGLRQEHATQAAGHKYRDEAQGKHHRSVEAQSAAENRPQPKQGNDGSGYGDNQGRDREQKAGIGAHPAEEHVMSPDHEAQETDGQKANHNYFVAEDGFAGENREHMRDHSETGDDCDVDLGMPEEPEQVLPQQW